MSTRRSGLAGQITSAITSLEALYLKGGEVSELLHRLSQRAAAVIGHCGLDTIKINEDLKASYKIRNAYVHGSVTSRRVDEETLKRAKKVLTYARISLLVFLQLQKLTKKAKEQFIKDIDESLLEHNKYLHLKENIKELCYYSQHDSEKLPKAERDSVN